MSEREDLFIGLLLCWLGQCVTELGEHRGRNTIHHHVVHGDRVAPVSGTRWLRRSLQSSRLRVDTGILEDAVQDVGRGNPDILGDTRDRWGRSAREDESANEEEHKQETALGGLLALGEGVFALLDRGNSHLLLDLGLGRVLVEEVGCIPGARHAHTVHNANLLPELAGLNGVSADHLFLLKVEVLDVVGVGLLLEKHLLKLATELSHLFLHVVDDGGVLLLLILQALCVLLLALS
ncbi:hypothetical protein HG531_002292 [Fusarium graminearum]|nr:hypothetical protein HG531_002292 [Fusarium graminearum]